MLNWYTVLKLSVSIKQLFYVLQIGKETVPSFRDVSKCGPHCTAPVSVNLAWQMSHAKQPFKGMIKHLLPIKGLMNLNFTDMITHKYSEAREKALSLT